MWFGAIFLPYDNGLTTYIFALGSCAYGWLLSLIVHHHFYSVETMKRELQTFRIAQAQCYCCSVKHVEADGDVIPCDREVMVRCISEWFGSVENFENSVQTRVKDALTQHLGGMCFPYSVIVIGGFPTLWAQMDFMAARFYDHDTFSALGCAITGIYATFVLTLPSAAVVLLVIRHTSHCSLVLSRVLAVATFLVTQSLMHGSVQVGIYCAGPLWGEMIWAGAWLAPSILIWCCANRSPRRSERTSERRRGRQHCLHLEDEQTIENPEVSRQEI